MAPTIFITGASGYIGGQLLHDLVAKHPQYQIRALVRTTEQQTKISAAYPSITLVLGDLDSSSILQSEAAKADIVLQLADADHTPAITTLIPCMGKNKTLIQLSGAASISTISATPGSFSAKKWNDVSDLREISSFPHSHLHAVTDQTVVSLGVKHGVRTALVIPPAVYGTGEGEVKTQSMVLPWYMDAVKKRGEALWWGEGSNVVSVVHVRDVSAAFVLLVEEALKEGGGKADWGEKGWYYVEGGEYVLRDMANAAVKAMVERGVIEKTGVESIGIEEAKELHTYAELLWGVNMRVDGERIRGLGWTAKEVDAFSTIPELLE